MNKNKKQYFFQCMFPIIKLIQFTQYNMSSPSYRLIFLIEQIVSKTALNSQLFSFDLVFTIYPIPMLSLFLLQARKFLSLIKKLSRKKDWMDIPLIRKNRFANTIDILTTESTINTFIYVFIGLQLVGEALLLSHFVHLKPVPIILLIIKSIFIVQCSKVISLALIFGLIGDVLLMFPTTLLFEFGAVAFLIGHIFYITYFVKNSKSSTSAFKFQNYLQHGLSLFIFSALVINAFTLWDHLPDRTLFMLYGIILSTMVICSFYRKSSEEMMLNYLYGIVGALSFLVSDYLIAYTKFMGLQTGLNGLFIMSLYYFAQFMILKGNSTAKRIIHV